MNFPTIEGCYQAKERLSNVSINTPFQFLDRISNNFNAEIYTKREDLQLVRSFKIRVRLIRSLLFLRMILKEV